MDMDRITTARIVDDLRLPERLAVWSLRCIAQQPRVCSGPESGLAVQLQPGIAGLQAFQQKMMAQCRPGLRVAPWGSRSLTRDECRLLRAVGALQAGATELADNLLFRFAPSRIVRTNLTQAVALLAAALGTEGYWLDQPLEPWTFAGASMAKAGAYENA